MRGAPKASIRAIHTGLRRRSPRPGPAARPRKQRCCRVVLRWGGSDSPGSHQRRVVRSTAATVVATVSGRSVEEEEEEEGGGRWGRESRAPRGHCRGFHSKDADPPPMQPRADGAPPCVVMSCESTGGSRQCVARRRPIRVGTAFEDEDASDPSAVDEEVHDARIERGPL